MCAPLLTDLSFFVLPHAIFSLLCPRLHMHYAHDSVFLSVPPCEQEYAMRCSCRYVPGRDHPHGPGAGQSVAFHSYVMPMRGVFHSSWMHTHAQAQSALWVLDVHASEVIPAHIYNTCFEAQVHRLLYAIIFYPALPLASVFARSAYSLLVLIVFPLFVCAASLVSNQLCFDESSWIC